MRSWDGILGKSIQRERGESMGNYINRAANLIMARHPQASLATRAKEMEFNELGTRRIAAEPDAGLSDDLAARRTAYRELPPHGV
jgi:hypothetical protein